MVAGCAAAWYLWPLNDQPSTTQLATGISVPSGQEVTLHEVVQSRRGPSGLTYRFRFIAPQVSHDTGTIKFEDAEIDMIHLCNTYAIPKTEGANPAPSQIVISLSDRIVEFGQSDAEATQFFEAYTITDGTCIWEGF